MASDKSQETIVIIGAGIIGLAISLRIQSLLSRDHSASRRPDVLLVAREWPTSIPGAPIHHSADYASMWAGAHVRPIPATTPQLKREATWLKRTVSELARQVESDPHIGITQTLGIEYLDTPSDGYRQQTKETFEESTGLSGYRSLSKSEMPEGVELGFEYNTFCINSPVYCANLLRKFLAQGGKTLGRDLKSEWEAFAVHPNVKLVINASGTGFNDTKYFPTRGQTVVTTLTQATKTVTRQHKDGRWSFIIPRFFDGGSIMGGTKQQDDWQTEPDENTRQVLLKDGSDLIPYAVEGASRDAVQPLGIIADVVGRRPTREGGARLEVEEKQIIGYDKQSRAGQVLHAYGVGGRGFEVGWGVADEVAEMASRLLPVLNTSRSKL